jgi:hypothetical protein
MELGGSAAPDKPMLITEKIIKEEVPGADC